MGRELVGAGGSFTTPERHAWRRALGVFDEHAARCDTTDAPGSVSEQHDVAREAFDRKVFVNRADGYAFGLRDNGIERIFGDCAAACDGSEPRSTAGAPNVGDAVAMQVGSVPAALAGDALRQHLDDFVETFALKIAVRIGAADRFVESVFRPVLCGTHGHDLLGENVHRGIWNNDAVEISLADGAN